MFIYWFISTTLNLSKRQVCVAIRIKSSKRGLRRAFCSSVNSVGSLLWIFSQSRDGLSAALSPPSSATPSTAAVLMLGLRFQPRGAGRIPSSGAQVQKQHAELGSFNVAFVNVTRTGIRYVHWLPERLSSWLACCRRKNIIFLISCLGFLLFATDYSSRG